MPYFVIKGQIWRFVSGTFINMTFLNFLFSMLSYIPSATLEESKIGTVHFAIRFWRLSIFINLMYSLFAIFVYLVFGYPGIVVAHSMGLWPLLFCDLAIECLRNPDMPRACCCCPIEIPSKYFPLLLIMIFTLLFGP